MSDTSILPTAAAAPPGVEPPDFGDESTDDRRRLMIIGGVVGAVLVIIVAYLLLRGGGSSSDELSAVPRGTPHAAASTATGSTGSSTSGSSGKSSHAGGASNEGKGVTTVPKKSHRQLAKDPFKPLVVDQEGGSTGSGTAVTGGGTTVTSSTGAPGAGTTTGGADGSAPDAAVGSPLSLRLVDVLGKSIAVFDVTYAHHKIFRFQVQAPPPTSTRGTVFAGDFALLGIQNKEATVQIGDGTPFDMRKGSSHSV